MDPTVQSSMSALVRFLPALQSIKLTHPLVTIGSGTMFGPNVSLYTPQHPISPEERNGLKGREWAVPISIGSDCWIGGNVTVCPGVTIGDGCTIGAGSVVTKDVPPRSVAVGNPARVIKSIPLPGEAEAEKA